MKRNRVRRQTGLFLPRAALVLAALLAAAFARAGEEAPAQLNAALLTRDLGDPRQPGNVQLVLGLPEALKAMTPDARAEDFRIYVHPVDLPREEGLTERYRAAGTYLWRHRNRIFLDARTVPQQDDEGEATVRVVFAPDGEALAEGVAEGRLRYTTDLVDVVLAVDVSRSMSYNDPQKRRVVAARAFIDMARQGGGIGRVGLVTFNHRSAKAAPLLPLEEGEALIRVLDTVGADGLTNLDGPILNALEELEGSRKPVIILLSDGKNEGARYRDSHLLAAERGARIFSVGLSEEADHELLKEMADSTGGIYFRAVKDSDLPEIYARLAAELGKRQLLRAEPLPSAYGETAYPIDATVKRLVALADGGAKIAAIGGAGMFSTAMSGVQMGRPEPGEWLFAWNNATPNVSTLALFGDTRFFLDVFPPQMLGDRLSVGATLAQGDRALTGGSVWIEPLAGVLPERMELFDDGGHGDGGANDGVYAGNAVVPDAPQRFDLTVRAAGTAWDAGDFIRQTAGLAIRAPAPPPESTVSFDGDVDFGVLFPGETGSADVTIDLNSPSAKQLRLGLSWDRTDAEWPDFASSLSAEPGKRTFELEITIPRTARPGIHEGEFTVTDGDEIDGKTRARVTVGTVEFTAPPALDLGAVPPGTFVTRTLEIPYRADKAAAVAVTDNSADVAAAPGAKTLAAGQGTLPVEITVSAPINKPEGEYAAALRITAGPGAAEIPLAWRVQQYAAAAPTIEPLSGLPSAPELPASAAPLEKTPGLSEEFWNPDQVAAVPPPVDSPWERTDKLLRRPDDQSGDDTRAGGLTQPGTFAFPEVKNDGGSSFWSAWWLYILAALLLLLLLLLLLAYLLYRLGKSALARFLLASALANIMLLVAFILLLGTGMSEPAARAAPETVTVNLVVDNPPVEVRLTSAEESLLSGDSAGSSGGGAAAAGESELARAEQSSAGGGELVEEKETRLPENDGPEAELADTLQPSAMPLAPKENRQLRRENRLPERATNALPAPAPAVMTEASAAENATATDADATTPAEPSEARLEIEAPVAAENPLWSTGEKPVESLADETGMLLAEAPGMETVTRDRTARRLEPRGTKRAPDATPVNYPEPRVRIDDPARDATESPAAASSDAGEVGVEEMRVTARSAGADAAGEKPGALLTPGAYRLPDNAADRRTRGISSAANTPELSRPVGGNRTARGATGRNESTAPGVANAAPGVSAANSGRSGTGSAANGNTNAGGASATGEAVGERRFDEAPSGASGGTGTPDASGGARTPATAPGGGGAGNSPSPVAAGGSGDARAAYVPAPGAGGGRSSGTADRPGAGRTGRSDSGMPSGANSVPGTGAGAPSSRNGNGSGGDSDDGDSSGRGRRSGTGEGRFDEMGTSNGTPGGQGRRGGAAPGVGSSALAEGSDDGPDTVSYENDEGEWKRIDRRQRPRSLAVAASAVDMDSLLIIVGDFARLPDSASKNLFSRFAHRVSGGILVEERLLAPTDSNLQDTLLALATPEQIASWSDAEVAAVAQYLEQGGHIWLDAENGEEEQTAMSRLASAADGEFSPLPATHQLAENSDVSALRIGDKLAAIATHRGWRQDRRFADSGGNNGNNRNNGNNAAADDGTMRFFVRTVNFFLSGDADSGVVLEPGDPVGDTLVQPYREIIPESLSGPPPATNAEVWDDFAPETAASWRMPPWSDAGNIAAISDGQGGRALKLDLGSAAKGRAALYRALSPEQNFADVSAMTLDVHYDGGGDADLSLVLTVNENGTWRDYESRPQRLNTGWNTIRFDFDAGEFRALTQGGPENGPPSAALARTGRAGFFLYRDGASAAMTLFRGIRLERR